MSGFKSTRGELNGRNHRAIMRAFEDVVREADKNAPVDEGTLHASITYRITSDTADSVRGEVGSALRYARMRELGGTIRPIRAKRLVWRGHDGKFHSAKVVTQQPGGRKGSSKHGKRYLEPAAKKFGQFFEEHARSAL